MGAYRLVVAYDGSGFAGWQHQPEQRTVEGVLSEVLARILRQPVDLHVASRTDAGVHALGQVVAFHVDSTLPPEIIARAANAYLPPDIAVCWAERVGVGYNLHRDIKGKRYRYWISDAPFGNPFLRAYQWHWRRGRLDVAAMDRAAQLLVGTHDFASFQNSGSPRVCTVRTLFQVRVERLELGWPNFTRTEVRWGEGECRRQLLRDGLSQATFFASPVEEFLRQVWGGGGIFVQVEGDGFLYNMVRTIVGSLVEVGRGARKPEWIRELLEARDRRCAGPTAPACGLFLEKVYLRECEADDSENVSGRLQRHAEGEGDANAAGA